MDRSIIKGLKDLTGDFKIGTGEFEFFSPDQGVKEEALIRDFNAITPTCYANTGWAGPYAYDFEAFNSWVNWGVKHDMSMIMHMISGPTQYFISWDGEKGWLKNIKWSGPELDHMYYEYIRAMMLSNDNYKKVYAWNVINEAFTMEGKYRPDKDIFLNVLGWEPDESGCTGEDKINDHHPSYISKAFKYAGMFAEGRLELRENFFEFAPHSAKTKALIQLIKHMRAKGIRCDAIGFQCHLWFWIEKSDDYIYNYDAFCENVKQFHDLGCEVYIGELDIPVFNGNLEKQGERFAEFIKACRRAGVEQVHTWGIADAESSWRADEAAFLFDGNYNEKPAYYAVAAALAAKP